jgi:clan AA aspartic protease
VKGTLRPDYTARIELEVLEAGCDCELIVDTGFDDCLYLPEDLITAWNLPVITGTTMSYADGSVVTTDLYGATVVWFGVAVPVTVLAGPVGCESLLGMGLLSGCRIELDEVAGEVRISKL